MQTKNFRHYIMDRWTDHDYHVFIRYYGIHQDQKPRQYIFQTDWAALIPYAVFDHAIVSYNGQMVQPTKNLTTNPHQVAVKLTTAVPLNGAITVHFVFHIIKPAPGGTNLNNEACLKIFSLHDPIMHDMYANTIQLIKRQLPLGQKK